MSSDEDDDDGDDDKNNNNNGFVWKNMRSVQKASNHVMKNRDIYWRRYKIQETLYIRQWCLSPLQSRHLGTSHSSQLPSAAPLYFPESHWWSEISSLSKVILVLGKARSCRAPNLGCRGAESPGWFDVLPKNSAQDMMHEQVRIVMMKLPITSCQQLRPSESLQ